LPNQSSSGCFEAYLRYREQYHIGFATSSWSARRNLKIVAFGKAAMESLAGSYHARFASGLQPAPFTVGHRVRERHPQWINRARPCIRRVAAVWDAVGLKFPVADLEQCW